MVPISIIRAGSFLSFLLPVYTIVFFSLEKEIFLPSSSFFFFLTSPPFVLTPFFSSSRFLPSLFFSPFLLFSGHLLHFISPLFFFRCSLVLELLVSTPARPHHFILHRHIFSAGKDKRVKKKKKKFPCYPVLLKSYIHFQNKRNVREIHNGIGVFLLSLFESRTEKKGSQTSAFFSFFDTKTNVENNKMHTTILLAVIRS